MFQGEREIKRLAIKNIRGTLLLFGQMVAELCEAAERTNLRVQERQRRKRGRVGGRLR